MFTNNSNAAAIKASILTYIDSFAIPIVTTKLAMLHRVWTLCLAQAAQISTQIERKRIDKKATTTTTMTASAATTTAYRQCTSQAHEHK